MLGIKKPIHGLEGLIILYLVGIMSNGIIGVMAPILIWVGSQMPGGNTAINQLFLAHSIQTMLIITLVAFFVRVVHQSDWSVLGLVKSPVKGWWLFSIFGGGALFISMIVLVAFLSMIWPSEVQPQAITDIILGANTPWERLVPLLVTGVFAPIGEELLFRGYIFNGFRRHLGTIPSVLLSAMIFGAMHFDLVRAIPLMLGGIGLNLIYIKTHSIYSAMIAHGVWNIAMTMTIYIG